MYWNLTPYYNIHNFYFCLSAKKEFKHIKVHWDCKLELKCLHWKIKSKLLNLKLSPCKQVSYKSQINTKRKGISAISALALVCCGLNLMRRIRCHHYPEATFSPMIKYALESQNRNNKQNLCRGKVDLRGERGGERGVKTWQRQEITWQEELAGRGEIGGCGGDRSR